jgi:glutamate---cysteine ligase / carboxylate-amine ligase
MDLDAAREIFETSQDLTVGIEEEWGLVDPETLELVPKFEAMRDDGLQDDVLKDAISGELISSEIEIRSGRGEDVQHALKLQREARRRLFALADKHGVTLASTGTHPLSDYRDQHIIQTEHYRRLEGDLRWVAQRNNTWSLHVHVGIRGADRVVAVSDRMREWLPILLAVSANSPFLDHRDTGLHSVRTEIFTRTFPRCGVHEPFGDWATYADFVRLLEETRSVAEATQLWWSVRPHHSFGTVEVRICDAQTRGDESFNLAALIAACATQAALEYDEVGYGGGRPLLPGREIEENLWRAIRHGMDAEMIDFRDRRTTPARAVLEELLEWTEPARSRLGVEVELPEENGAQRAHRALAERASIEEIYRHAVEETKRTYAPEGVAGAR